jgi:hypothetical protein
MKNFLKKDIFVIIIITWFLYSLIKKVFFIFIIINRDTEFS